MSVRASTASNLLFWQMEQAPIFKTRRCRQINTCYEYCTWDCAKGYRWLSVMIMSSFSSFRRIYVLILTAISSRKAYCRYCTILSKVCCVIAKLSRISAKNDHFGISVKSLISWWLLKYLGLSCNCKNRIKWDRFVNFCLFFAFQSFFRIPLQNVICRFSA